MAQAHARRAPEHGKSGGVDQPVTRPALLALGIRQSEHEPPLVQRELHAGRFPVRGDGAAPVGMVTMRLRLRLEIPPYPVDETVGLGDRGRAARWRLLGVEYERVARIFAMAG